MNARKPKHIIEILNRPRNVPARSIKALGAELLNRMDSKPSRVTLAFIDDERIRELNLKYRNKDSTTDVLSFPISERGQDGRMYLGDIVISTEVARKQAKQLNHEYFVEIFELFTHGLLHLCGYDHEVDDGEMNELELQLRTEIVGRYCR